MATDDASKPAEKDIRWVERQASFVGIAAMFPRPVFEPMVRKYWKEVANNQDNLGQKLAGIISKICSLFGMFRQPLRLSMEDDIVFGFFSTKVVLLWVPCSGKIEMISFCSIHHRYFDGVILPHLEPLW